MRISHKYKFIFFANPKTGSESVRDFLDSISDVKGIGFPATTPDFPFYSHMRPVEAKEAFARNGWPFNDYYRFVFVRNPWRRLVSLYAMIRKVDPRFTEPFADWLRQSSPEGAGGGGHDSQRWRKYGTYSLRNFVGGDMSLVDDVFRMEDMDSVPARLALKGLPVSSASAIKHVNAGRIGPSYEAYYTRDLAELVRARYAEEIEMFGYQMTQPVT